MAKKNNQKLDLLEDDLGLKIGTEREAFLTRVKESLEQENKQCHQTLDLNKMFLKSVEREIKKEKETFK